MESGANKLNRNRQPTVVNATTSGRARRDEEITRERRIAFLSPTRSGASALTDTSHRNRPYGRSWPFCKPDSAYARVAVHNTLAATATSPTGGRSNSSTQQRQDGE